MIDDVHVCGYIYSPTRAVLMLSSPRHKFEDKLQFASRDLISSINEVERKMPFSTLLPPVALLCSGASQWKLGRSFKFRRKKHMHDYNLNFIKNRENAIFVKISSMINESFIVGLLNPSFITWYFFPHHLSVYNGSI